MKNLLCFRHFFCLFVIVIFSCGRFSEHEYAEFILPENSAWKISASNGQEFSFNGRKFSIEAEKNQPLAVLAKSSSGNLSGAIYPYDDELKPSRAFPAQVLYSLILSSSNSHDEKMHCLSTFNWKKFELECEKMGDDIWKVNKEIIMKKIAGGTFKKSDLKIEKTKRTR